MPDTEALRPEPSATYRWIVLVVISLTMFGNYYIYDAINPVTDLFKTQLGFSDQEIGRLNSIYSVAAVVVLLIGGIIIDRLGTKISVLIFSILCLVAAILTVATTVPSVILAGRFVLGLGAEPLIVAVTTALAKWFKGKELSFAFGLNLTVARLGSVAADNSPTWAKTIVDFGNWRGPLTIGVAAGVICVIAAVAYWMLESTAARRYRLGRATETEKLVFGDLFRFGVSFFFVVGLCFAFYSAVFPFRTFAVKFFIEGHGTTRELGGQLNSIIPTAAIVATPLFGLLVDRIGRRGLLMIFGSLLLVPAYLLMLPGLGVSLYPSTIMLGIAFSLVPAVMWPSVAYIVEENRLGTAYSLMTLIQQIGFFVMNELIGKLNDRFGASAANPDAYAPMLYALSALGFVGVAFAVMLRARESGPYGHGLERITTKTAVAES